MNETLQMGNLDLDDEVVYTDEELEGIYKAYEERVIRKREFKMWAKEFLK